MVSNRTLNSKNIIFREASAKDIDQMDNYCKSKNLDWFASSWDEESQKIMRKYNFPFNKIASAMSVHKSFVELVASEIKPTFVSTGMMEIDDIDKVVDIFRKHKCPLMLMHTVSTYPSKIENLNLRLRRLNLFFQPFLHEKKAFFVLIYCRAKCQQNVIF